MKKLVLLALAVVSAAMFALPAVAAAGEPETDCPGGAATCSFTTSGEALTWTTANGTTINCTSSTGTGSYTSKTTGTIGLTYSGCKESVFGTSCGTSGVIKTSTAVFHNVYTADNKTSPGLLITQPAAGTFASFSCGGGLLTVSVTGNVIGSLESPGCGSEAELWPLNFTESAHGNQTLKQVTGTGSAFDLLAHLNTGGTQTTAVAATWKIKFTGKAKLTCI
jgi:hypothetical protein